MWKVWTFLTLSEKYKQSLTIGWKVWIPKGINSLTIVWIVDIFATFVKCCEITAMSIFLIMSLKNCKCGNDYTVVLDLSCVCKWKSKHTSQKFRNVQNLFRIFSTKTCIFRISLLCSDYRLYYIFFSMFMINEIKENPLL